MPKITLEEARLNYQTWRAAELALATGQSYSIAGRSLTRVDMPTILERIRYWGRIVDELENPGKRRRKKTRAFTPFDI
ncbi:DUF6148 family protein [Paenibacillus brevis]|uniref:Uncharacterized protein n=1 Tax=Paenibacillus brevis TaxID=2841508 RepID=A0ABS6FRN3_9BACL|nr:DUF6148 family protein [Paenibacillus brevis]MBU5672634.1 hypothetical protein [Paenibacillus brevis]